MLVPCVAIAIDAQAFIRAASHKHGRAVVVDKFFQLMNKIIGGPQSPFALQQNGVAFQANARQHRFWPRD